VNRFLLAATKLEIRIYGSEFKGLSVVKHPNGQEQEVVVFAKGYVAGITTAVNTIGLHELVFRSEKLLNETIVHEVTHKKELHGPIYYLLAVLLPLGLWFALSWVGLLVGFIIWWFAVQWFTEFRAYCQAIRTLGIQAVLEARQDYLTLFEPSALIRIVGFSVTHPPLPLVIRICRLLHKDVH